jgi:hypothetical protein
MQTAAALRIMVSVSPYVVCVVRIRPSWHKSDPRNHTHKRLQTASNTFVTLLLRACTNRDKFFGILMAYAGSRK